MANTNVKRVKTSDLELKDRLVAINRVTKVTKGGRHFRFAAIVVVGDENGVVGYGLGKANEVTAAIAKGVEDAKKNLVKIPIINTTIPHEQVARFGGAEVFMKPAAPGTGVPRAPRELHEDCFTGTGGPLIVAHYEKVQYQERRHRVRECR